MVRVVTGAQFGDEGKGKLVDHLAADADVVVRFQGGDNAGHTVVANDRELKLHLVPSGVLHDCRVLLGPNVVLNPQEWLDELRSLEEAGIEIGPDTMGVDPKTSIIMPYHREIDRLEEEQRDSSIGTTQRGIGQAYVDKVAREEIQVADIIDADRFAERHEQLAEQKAEVIERLGGDPDDAYKVHEDIEAIRERLRACVADVPKELHEHREAGRDIIAEGAQGTFLDVVHGTQKYVTSSSTIAGAACPGLGVGPNAITDSIGVLKAYITRVGKGPLPTELTGATGEQLREQGGEYGTTTGRPRRCGWLDLPLARKAVRLNGYDRIALTKIDVLSGIDPLQVCVGYDLDGERIEEPPATTQELARCEPVYEEVPGWDADITDADAMAELPQEARDYVTYIEETLGIPVDVVSVGPGRTQTIYRDG